MSPSTSFSDGLMLILYVSVAVFCSALLVSSIIAMYRLTVGRRRTSGLQLRFQTYSNNNSHRAKSQDIMFSMISFGELSVLLGSQLSRSLSLIHI